MSPSFRTSKAERKYQKMKANGELPGLKNEPRIRQFKHWYVVINRAHGNKMFSTHNLLVANEEVGDWDLLSQAAKNEFWKIRREYILTNYDLNYENSPPLRSVSGHYHIHLVDFKPRFSWRNLFKKGQ